MGLLPGHTICQIPRTARITATGTTARVAPSSITAGAGAAAHLTTAATTMRATHLFHRYGMTVLLPGSAASVIGTTPHIHKAEATTPDTQPQAGTTMIAAAPEAALEAAPEAAPEAASEAAPEATLVVTEEVCTRKALR